MSAYSFEGDFRDQPRPEPDAPATDETPYHPSPSKRFNPLKPFETNLSSIRHREEPDSTPSVSSTSSTSDTRSTHLRSRTSPSKLSCRRNLFSSIFDVSSIDEGSYCHLTQDDTDVSLSSSDSNPSTQASEPGLLDVIGCGDIGNVILDKCGVICLAKLSTACKASRETVQQYNRHTKRIFPVRCGGHDHEFYTFWKEYDKERVARALSEHPISMRSAYSAQIYHKEQAARATLQGTLDTDTLLRNDTPTNEAFQTSPSPSKSLQSQTSPSSNFISDVSSVRDSLSFSGGTDEVLHPSDPSRPNPEVKGFAARAKTNPPTPMIFSIGSAQACSTSSVSKANTKRHRYFTRYSKRNNEG